MIRNPLVDQNDVDFVLFEMLKLEDLSKYEYFAEFDKETYEATLELALKMAIEEVYPVNKEADEIGVRYDPDTKKVIIPEGYKGALQKYCESGFVGMIEPPEYGGMGMPGGIAAACSEMFTAASLSFTMYPGLAHGAAALIKNFGTEKQKELYLERMLTGQWGGTMCLTEPDAGSDVGNLKTKAIPQPDGTYLIKGQKIFITAGDNDYYENIIHPVLARIEGDPPGTKGISLFIVPKFRVNPDGSLGEPNDVVCTGIEHKLGIHGSATCSLSFGDNNQCIGEILGEPRKGMKIMFQMMNEARLGVALQGLSLSSTAYMHAVTYARNRIQGVHATQMLNPDAPRVAIIEHPDVKRMLLWMKSYVEGCRMLVYYLAHNATLHEVLPEGEEKKEAQAMVEILIPIAKAGCTDTALLVSSEAIQVYGGYGYTKDYPVEQYLRDAKITQIYEGTNGIQSMDLTFRKILMSPDQYNYSIMKKQMLSTIDKAKGIVDEKYINLVNKGIDKLDEVIEMLKGFMNQGKFLHIFAAATPLQQAMFMLVLAWLHLWSLSITLPKMKQLTGDAKGSDLENLLADNDEAAYYSGTVLSSQYYIGSEFPKYFGKIESLLFNETATIKASKNIFTGALLE